MKKINETALTAVIAVIAVIGAFFVFDGITAKTATTANSLFSSNKKSDLTKALEEMCDHGYSSYYECLKTLNIAYRTYIPSLYQEVADGADERLLRYLKGNRKFYLRILDKCKQPLEHYRWKSEALIVGKDSAALICEIDYRLEFLDYLSSVRAQR